MKKTILIISLFALFLTGCEQQNTNLIGSELDLAPPEDELPADPLDDSELELAPPEDELPADPLDDSELDLAPPEDELPADPLDDSELDLAPPEDELPADPLDDSELELAPPEDELPADPLDDSELDLAPPEDELPADPLDDSQLDLAPPEDELPADLLDDSELDLAPPEDELPEDEKRTGGSCNLIAKTSTCLEYKGSFWTKEQMKNNCYEGVFSFSPCESGNIGGCETGRGSFINMIIYMYPYGGAPISGKDAENAKPVCDMNPMGNWVNAK